MRRFLLFLSALGLSMSLMAVLCACILSAYVLLPNGMAIESRGMCAVAYFAPDAWHDTLQVYIDGDDPWIQWTPAYYDFQDSSQVWIPLWMPTLAFMVLLGILTWPIYRRYRRRRKNLCVNCGYDLRGLTRQRCPECDTPFGELAPTDIGTHDAPVSTLNACLSVGFGMCLGLALIGSVVLWVPLWMPTLVLIVLLGIVTWPICRWYRRRRSNLCANCGYDLRGLTRQTCPECNLSGDPGPTDGGPGAVAGSKLKACLRAGFGTCLGLALLGSVVLWACSYSDNHLQFNKDETLFLSEGYLAYEDTGQLELAVDNTWLLDGVATHPTETRLYVRWDDIVTRLRLPLWLPTVLSSAACILFVVLPLRRQRRTKAIDSVECAEEPTATEH